MITTNAVQSVPSSEVNVDIIGILKKRRSPMAMVIILLLAVTTIVAVVWPPVYRSSATILIEQQEIPEELVRSTITTFADQRIQVISQRVMTSSNLKKIIEKYELYTEKRKRYPDEVIIEDMRQDIVRKIISADVIDPRSGRATKATIAFGLAYENESPRLAQKVASELSSLYLNENLKSRHAMAEETTNFLELEADKLKSQIERIEQRVTEFKKENFSKLPEMTKLNLRNLEKTEQQLMDADRRIDLLEERKIMMVLELQKIDPMKDLISQGGQPLLSANGRMKVLFNRFTRLSSVYSLEHPDIIRTLRDMEYLKMELGSATNLIESHKQILQAGRELSQLKQDYTAEHPAVLRAQKQLITLQQMLNQEVEDVYKHVLSENIDEEKEVVSDNPAYLQVQAQIDTADLQIRSMRSQQVELRHLIDEYEQLLVDTPAVERDYRELLREYDNKTIKFREVKAKQMEAQLAQSLETAQKSERFTLIEPPFMPENPVRPNRLAIAAVGIILSLVAGFALGYLLERTDKSVRGAQGVMDLVGVMPLATVPYILTPLEARKQKLLKWKVLGLTIVVIIAIPMLFHFFYMPLDVFYYVVDRKFGLGL